MANRIKAPIQKNKISPKSADGNCFSDQYPWFSFKALTRNSRYNLNTLSGRDAELTLKGLYNKLQDLSSKPWYHWMGLRKAAGLETMDYQNINFKANAELAKDTTLYVFGFDTYQGVGKGRIIGYKDSPCSVLHIIGFDIDFSAYKH